MLKYLAAILLITTAAYGQVVEAPWRVQTPPHNYDHPYRGKMVVSWVDSYRLGAVCGSWRVYGCAMPGKVCRIWIHQNWRSHEFGQVVLRHERAHCNGWIH